MRCIRPLILVALVAAAAGCGSESVESQIRRTVDAAVEAAETRDLDGVMEHVADAFVDAAGNDKAALRARIAFHFRQHGAVYVWTRERRLTVAEDGSARYEAWVALAGRPIDPRVDVTAFDADLLEIDVRFRRDGKRWRVVEAAWRPVRPEDRP